MFTATSKLIIKEFDKHRDLTAKQIASAVGISEYRAREIVKKWHGEGLIYKSGWLRANHHIVPIYRFGKGKDAEKIKPIPAKIRKQKYLKKLREWLDSGIQTTPCTDELKAKQE